MTDKKLTDEEIIKCLKFCEDCSANINVEILDLINRQKAEIERLKDKIFVLENDLEKAETLSDALGNDVDIKLNHIYDLEEKLKKVKSEAIKEFAERLKKEALKHKIFPLDSCVDFDDIDNLVKEMTEVQE